MPGGGAKICTCAGQGLWGTGVKRLVHRCMGAQWDVAMDIYVSEGQGGSVCASGDGVLMCMCSEFTTSGVGLHSHGVRPGVAGGTGPQLPRVGRVGRNARMHVQGSGEARH